jgi:hypothetical protein
MGGGGEGLVGGGGHGSWGTIESPSVRVPFPAARGKREF